MEVPQYANSESYTGNGKCVVAENIYIPPPSTPMEGIFLHPSPRRKFHFRSIHCVVPEKNSYPPHGGSLKIPSWGGGGVLKAKFLEAMYENKLEFPRGRGCKTKNLLVEGGG